MTQPPAAAGPPGAYTHIQFAFDPARADTRARVNVRCNRAGLERLAAILHDLAAPTHPPTVTLTDGFGSTVTFTRTTSAFAVEGNIVRFAATASGTAEEFTRIADMVAGLLEEEHIGDFVRLMWTEDDHPGPDAMDLFIGHENILQSARKEE